ncbi:MAG: activase, partial [Desulfuromonadales bacterium]|nr:activase [Desulfuromonadales bacterium]
MIKAAGFCLGASTISIAWRTETGIRIERCAHNGEIGERFQTLLERFAPARIGVTGNKFRNQMAIPTIAEPEAVELAFAHLRPHYPATDCIVSAGGEMFIAYLLDPRGRIRTVQTGSKCAAGTGEFFLQQIRRMGLQVDQALDLAATATPYAVAGRCSVFCKSDCTHALNKGVPKGEVVAGLCRMMAGKVLELLQKSRAERIALIGGVSLNRVVRELLRRTLPELYVPAEAQGFEALGALLWAEKAGVRPGGSALLGAATGSFSRLPPLSQGEQKVSYKTSPPGEFYSGDFLLGLDVGSTTTKAVLMRADNRGIAASAYLRTDGDPVLASRRCYRQLQNQLPDGWRPTIVGLGVTGSGRQIAALHALTEGVTNEIIAHAAAAVHFDPQVDTIFEIGGQDAKFTGLVNGVPCEYAMNEACSAGTGSFLEEACRESLGIATVEIAEIALRATGAPNFNDQCSAFIGSDIKTAVQEGVKLNVILLDNHGYKSIGSLSRSLGQDGFGTRYIYPQDGVLVGDSAGDAVETLHIDYAENAHSLGAHVIRARTYDDFVAALKT